MVSIIVPVYNGEQTILRAVQSVLEQSVPDWELIVVDDGSEDGTGGLLSRLTDPRLIRLWQRHQERSAARNRGLDVARGELVLFLDADDWLMPNTVERLQELARSEPGHGVFVGDVQMCRDDGSVIARMSELVAPLPAESSVLERLVLDRNVVGQNRTAARLEVIRKEEITFDVELAYPEDWVFWLRVVSRSKVLFIPDVLGAYRWHAASTTHRSTAGYRHNQLAQARRKIMRMDFFPGLSVATRTHFFYQLLIEDLSGNGAAQREVVSRPEFLELPNRDRSRLLRLVARDDLMAARDTRQVRFWLDRARAVPGLDFRAELLRLAVAGSPALSRSLLQLVEAFRRKRTSDPLQLPAEVYVAADPDPSAPAGSSAGLHGS